IVGLADAEGRFQLRPPASSVTPIEIHPPADTPYAAVYKEVVWPKGKLRQTLEVALPRGVVLRGRVVDENDLPVADASVMFHNPIQGKVAHRAEVMQEWYRIVTVDANGRFRLTVPAGPVQVLARGPTHHWQTQTVRFWGPLTDDQGR